MASRHWRIWLGVALVAASAACFIVQYLIFHRLRDTEFYILQDLGSLWLSVLLVTLVIDQLLRRHDASLIRHKLNMVISAFFNEAGLDLLRYLSLFDTHPEQIKEITSPRERWTARRFAEVKRQLETYDYTMDCHCADLVDLRDMLVRERSFFLQLLMNPNLLEHESFTEMLWAISHLAQELLCRNDLENLPEEDYHHLEEDMRRVYVLLMYQWMLYIWHLQHTHPYLYDFIINRSERCSPHRR